MKIEEATEKIKDVKNPDQTAGIELDVNEIVQKLL
jgi:hypothetical protein